MQNINYKDNSMKGPAKNLQVKNLFLGLDVGSVSTNIVVVEEDGRLIDKLYILKDE